MTHNRHLSMLDNVTCNAGGGPPSPQQQQLGQDSLPLRKFGPRDGPRAATGSAFRLRLP